MVSRQCLSFVARDPVCAPSYRRVCLHFASLEIPQIGHKPGHKARSFSKANFSKTNKTIDDDLLKINVALPATGEQDPRIFNHSNQ